MQERWKVLGATALMVGLLAWSYFYFRSSYAHSKRLRVVEEGRVYRSGQLTAEGFTDAVQRFGIRTIINLQDDNLDPQLQHSYLDRRTIRESELCQQLGVDYFALEPDLVAPENETARPKVIEKFLKIMDKESTYPVLIHCKAGLHRTGLLSAIYRMEYQRWARADAYRELKKHGFGEWASTRANAYVEQYVFRYEPRELALRTSD